MHALQAPHDEASYQSMILPLPTRREGCQLCDHHPLDRFEVAGQTTLWRCAACGLFQNGRLVSASEYDAHYQQGYRHRRSRKLKTALQRMSLLESLLKCHSGRLLDVGCSVGCMLEAAESRGWEAVGVDLSDEAVRICRERGLNGLLVDRGSLPFEPESFDVVTTWHVVEHVADVQAALMEWNRVLRPGGVLALETPDASYIKARILGPAFRKFWPPHHTYTFTQSTLQPFLERAGFGIERAPLWSRFRACCNQGGYGALYHAYHAGRRMVGLRKNLQILARKKRRAQSLGRRATAAA